MKDKIVLNSAEKRRLLVLNQLEAGVLSAAQAGQLLGLAERQLRRLRAGYRQEGASALAHGNRGKRPVNAVDLEVAQRVVELAQTTYLGFNQQHLTEMLAEREGLYLSRPTVHRILRTAGLSAPRKRVRPGPTTGGTGWQRRGASCRWMAAGTTGWRAGVLT